MQIIPLSEGRFLVNRSKQFVPVASEPDKTTLPVEGGLLVEVQPFVVITQTDCILIDTGLGQSQEGELHIYKQLRKNNLSPDQITIVLMSHLHKDHAGGLIQITSPRQALNFPNARYYIQSSELDYALQKGLPSYDIEKLVHLKNHSQIHWVNGQGHINETIQYAQTSGHCPFHQVFWIKEAAQCFFYGGDEAPMFQQLKHRFIAKYDFDGKQAMALRQQWVEQGTKEHWTFLFYHDINTPFITL